MQQWWQQSWHYWQAGGPLLIPIALVSLGVWAYFWRSRTYLLDWLGHPHRLESVLTPQAPKQPEQLCHHLQSIPGALARMIVAVLQDNRQGCHLNEAFARRQHQGLLHLQKDLVILSALTAVAPLLGLLGTVIGMIQTFAAVSQTQVDTGSHVAAGISQALITTQFGLIVALPGVFGLARLQRLLQQVRAQMSETRVRLLALLPSCEVGDES